MLSSSGSYARSCGKLAGKLVDKMQMEVEIYKILYT